MIARARFETWILQVSERFSDIQQFYDSEFYNSFVDWEQNALDVIDNHDTVDINTANEVFFEVQEILNNARDNVDWIARGSAQFESRFGDLVYPAAWDYWNARRYEIQSTLFENLRELTGGSDECFRFDERVQDALISIPLTRLSVEPGAMVYVGNATSSTLHLCCDVPSIPEDLDARGTVQRILNPELERNQWQRALITRRVKHISSFLRNGNSFSLIQ